MCSLKSRQVRKNVDLSKRYVFPAHLYEIGYKGKTMVVARETANWIVLDNVSQLRFFHLLQNNAVGEALQIFEGDVSDAKNVITQLEARGFENTEVRHYAFDFSLHLYLTSACNLRCPHCYMFAGEKSDNELTAEEVKFLLEEFKRNGGSKLVLSGGEVCMRDDFVDIVLYAASLKLGISILTNGTMWSETMVGILAPHINRIQVSIDGYSEETNAVVRGKGNFGKVLDTVDRFVNAGVFTEVAVTPLLRKTLAVEAEKYAEFGRSLLDRYRGSRFNVKFTGELMDGRELTLTPEQKYEYLKISEKVFTDCYGDISSIPFIKAHRNKEISENCNYGNMSVSCCGDVYLCAALPNVRSVGNIRDVPFERFVEIRNTAFEKSNVNNIMPCRECALKYICGGECRVVHFKEFEDSDVDNITQYPVRKCDAGTKSKYLDLMLRTNRSLFQ